MKDIFDLIESQQARMHSMHEDFMSLMREAMATSDYGGARSVSMEEIEGDEGELRGDLIDGWGRIPEEEHDGVEYDGLGLAEVGSYAEDEIDIDDPSWARGRFMGLPQSVSLDFSPRGQMDSLLPLKGLFEEDGGV